MRYMAAAIAGATLLIGIQHARAAGAPQVWQGTAFIKAVTPACTTANVAAAGDYYTLVYRPIIAGSADNTGNEGLTFLSPRNALHYYTPTASGQSFRTAGTANIVDISSHAGSSTTTGTYSLAFTPATPSLSSAQIYISGGLENFWVTKGCTVTLTASLDRRID